MAQRYGNQVDKKIEVDGEAIELVKFKGIDVMGEEFGAQKEFIRNISSRLDTFFTENVLDAMSAERKTAINSSQGNLNISFDFSDLVDGLRTQMTGEDFFSIGQLLGDMVDIAGLVKHYESTLPKGTDEPKMALASMLAAHAMGFGNHFCAVAIGYSIQGGGLVSMFRVLSTLPPDQEKVKLLEASGGHMLANLPAGLKDNFHQFENFADAGNEKKHAEWLLKTSALYCALIGSSSCPVIETVYTSAILENVYSFLVYSKLAATKGSKSVSGILSGLQAICTGRGYWIEKECTTVTALGADLKETFKLPFIPRFYQTIVSFKKEYEEQTHRGNLNGRVVAGNRAQSLRWCIEGLITSSVMCTLVDANNTYLSMKKKRQPGGDNIIENHCKRISWFCSNAVGLDQVIDEFRLFADNFENHSEMTKTSRSNSISDDITNKIMSKVTRAEIELSSNEYGGGRKNQAIRGAQSTRSILRGRGGRGQGRIGSSQNARGAAMQQRPKQAQGNSNFDDVRGEVGDYDEEDEDFQARDGYQRY